MLKEMGRRVGKRARCLAAPYLRYRDLRSVREGLINVSCRVAVTLATGKKKGKKPFIEKSSGLVEAIKTPQGRDFYGVSQLTRRGCFQR